MLPSPRPGPSTTHTSTTAGAASLRPRSPEPHLSVSKRNMAAEVLQSYEQLSWYAMSRNESLPQTRLHFLSLLSGFTNADEDAQVDWKTDSTHHNAPALPSSVHSRAEPLGGEGRRKCSTVGKGKEKERASLGGGSRVGEGRGSPGVSGSGKKRKSVRIGS